MVAGDQLELTVAPKGFGSENMTALKMFTPSATREDIISFLVETVERAGSNPCPPVVVGVGLGGTSEMAALLAKQSLLRPVDQRSSDPFYAGMEAEALERINALGIGPQGLGGSTTALSVAITPYPTPHRRAALRGESGLPCHPPRQPDAVMCV